MTIGAATAETLQAALTNADRSRILTYCGLLVLLVEFGAPYNGLIDVPITFFLNHRLHLPADQIAGFRLVAAVPLYLAFLFGLARDRLNPLGRGDRGFLMLFGGLTACVYLALAIVPVSRTTLMVGVLGLNCAYLLAACSMRGLLSVIGQQHLMSGRVSTVWNLVLAAPLVASYFIGGALSQQLEGSGAQAAARGLFLVGAAIMGLIAAYGVWRPKVVFDSLSNERPQPTTLLADIQRLARHRPIYPAIIIWMLWEFSPGSQTVLQIYMTKTLGASDAVWGQYNAIYYAAYVPTYLLFAFLCRRVALRKLLWVATLVAIPQMAPLMLIHSAGQALLCAIPIGLMGGMAEAAYLDLIIRSCPRGLQGTAQGLSVAVFWLAIRFGDLLGASIYDHFGGFVVCAWVTMGVYALILPVLLFVPKGLTATRDGEVAD